MKLSLLVPSRRPEGLALLESSLRELSVTDAVELVMLVDDDLPYVEYHHNRIVAHHPPQPQVSIAQLLDECYRHATGDWVMFGNDDIVCQTPGWDRVVFEAIDQHGRDGLALFWPEDAMFGAKLACFPIVSRVLLDLVGFFPQPYRRYKVDDTLFAIVPPERRHFLPSVRFRHFNDQGTAGYPLGNGRVYPIDRAAAAFDTAQWACESARRQRMQATISEQCKEVTHG